MVKKTNTHKPIKDDLGTPPKGESGVPYEDRIQTLFNELKIELNLLRPIKIKCSLLDTCQIHLLESEHYYKKLNRRNKIKIKPGIGN